MGKMNKIKHRSDVPEALIENGEEFMAMFDGCNGQREPEVEKNIQTNLGSEDDRSTESELEEVRPTKSQVESDVQSESSESSMSMSSEDSLVCFKALKTQSKSKNQSRYPKNELHCTTSKPDRSFMSTKIMKIHGKDASDSLPVNAPSAHKEAEAERDLFRCVSREVQNLGTKGMTKKATGKWNQQAWERLGGKQEKSHRIPKSSGSVMFRKKLARENAARQAAASKGTVLLESMNAHKHQKALRKKFSDKRRKTKYRSLSHRKLQ